MAADTSFVYIPRSWSARIGYLSATDTQRIYNAGSRNGSISTRTGATEANSFAALASFGANGGRIDNISIRSACATTKAMTSNVIRFFHQKQGSTRQMFREYAITGSIASATAIGFEKDLTGLNWTFEPNSTLYVTCESAAQEGDLFDIIVTFGGDF